MTTSQGGGGGKRLCETQGKSREDRGSGGRGQVLCSFHYKKFRFGKVLETEETLFKFEEVDRRFRRTYPGRIGRWEWRVVSGYCGSESYLGGIRLGSVPYLTNTKTTRPWGPSLVLSIGPSFLDSSRTTFRGVVHPLGSTRGHVLRVLPVPSTHE